MKTYIDGKMDRQMQDVREFAMWRSQINQTIEESRNDIKELYDTAQLQSEKINRIEVILAQHNENLSLIKEIKATVKDVDTSIKGLLMKNAEQSIRVDALEQKCERCARVKA
ncbi:MAG: hypothetical protein WHV28_08895 [Bacteroidota bacterium]